MKIMPIIDRIFSVSIQTIPNIIIDLIKEPTIVVSDMFTERDSGDLITKVHRV